MRIHINYSLYLIAIFLSVSNVFASPHIQTIEYFIDVDPGYGKGQEVFVDTSSNNLTLDFTINLNDLADGFHNLFIRAMDTNQIWSINYQRPFYKQRKSALDTLPNIVQAEFFIDIDPGLGNGINLITEQKPKLSKNFVVDLSNISNGFHILNLRAKDKTGTWSNIYSRPFFKSEGLIPNKIPNIVQMEYYLDSDCEVGKGINVPISSGNEVESHFFVNLNNIDISSHTFYIRVKYENGIWSKPKTVNFLLASNNLVDVILILHSLAQIPLPIGLEYAYEGLQKVVPDGVVDIKDAIQILGNLSATKLSDWASDEIFEDLSWGLVQGLGGAVKGLVSNLDNLRN